MPRKRGSSLRRREFITFLGGATAWPLIVRAQQPDRMRHIGILMAFAEGDAEGQGFVTAFREGLRKLGWTEGQNIQIDIRWATPDTALIQQIRTGDQPQDRKGAGP